MGAPSLRKLVAPARVGLAILLGSVLCGRVCRADDAQELELAKNRFNGGEYDQAHDQLTVLLDPALPVCDKGPSGACRIVDADLVERARVFDAASLMAMRRGPEADAEIEKVLRQDPSYAPSTALFPQEVVDRFTEVRGRLRVELEQASEQQAREALKRRIAEQQAREAQEKWIADLQRAASTERRVTKNSRLLALVPLGVGQYQNGDFRLGVFFSISEAIFGATSVASAAIVANYTQQFDPKRSCNQRCYDELNAYVAASALVNRIAFTGWAVLTTAGLLQAQIGFVPEKTTVLTHPLPPRPKLSPTMSVGPGGVGIGLVGTF